MAGDDSRQGSEKPSEQRGGTTPGGAEAREKGEWAGTAGEGSSRRARRIRRPARDARRRPAARERGARRARPARTSRRPTAASTPPRATTRTRRPTAARGSRTAPSRTRRTSPRRPCSARRTTPAETPSGAAAQAHRAVDRDVPKRHAVAVEHLDLADDRAGDRRRRRAVADAEAARREQLPVARRDDLAVAGVAEVEELAGRAARRVEEDALRRRAGAVQPQRQRARVGVVAGAGMGDLRRPPRPSS